MNKKIFENNKLIAEFDEHEFYAKKGKYLRTTLPSNNIDFKDKGNTMHYHEVWNWLMSVIVKIGDMGYIIRIITSPTISKKWIMHSIKISKNTIGSLGKPEVNIESNYTNHESLHSSLYRSVIEFVKWYNKEKKCPTKK